MRSLLAGLTAVTMLSVLTGVGVLAEESGPHVADECGDADVMVRVGDVTMGTPDEERAAGFDIEAAWFEDVFEAGAHVGVRVHLDLCGDVPEPELPSSIWGVRWKVEESCSRVLSVRDAGRSADGSAEVFRRAVLSAQCAQPSSIPLIGGSESTTVWSAVLDDGAYSIDGSRITWTLTPDIVPDEHADWLEFLTPGEVWRAPSADARDGRWVTEADLGIVRLSGPGAIDSTAEGRDFTVGEVTP